MIPFRFHLASLTAVFLALAAGIVIGAGVVDRATVDFLQRRVDQVEANRRATNERNDTLATDVTRWRRFVEEVGGRPVAASLDGAVVVTVAVTGMEQSVVEGLAAELRAAGATSRGTVWLTGKWALDAEDDRGAMADLLGAAPTLSADELRSVAVARLPAAFDSLVTTGNLEAAAVLGALRERGFAIVEPDPAGAAASPPSEPPLFLVASGPGAEAPTALTVAVASELGATGRRVVAVEPSIDEEARASSMVVALRANPEVATVVATVDNADDARGRVAAVLALADRRDGRVGHYGFGPGVDRLVPDPTGPGP